MPVQLDEESNNDPSEGDDQEWEEVWDLSQSPQDGVRFFCNDASAILQSQVVLAWDALVYFSAHTLITISKTIMTSVFGRIIVLPNGTLLIASGCK